MVSTNDFYGSYFGHPVTMLRDLHDALRATDGGAAGTHVRALDVRTRSCIFLAGDSSLDNKHADIFAF